MWFPDFTAQTGAKYLVLCDAILRAVKDGHLEVGEKLPPVRELAYQIAITPGTVARAYSRLVDGGVLEAVVGRGTFVATPRAVTQTSDWPQVLDLRTPRLPEAGQSEMLRTSLRKLANMPDALLKIYPSEQTDRPAREAVLKWSSGKVLGPVGVDDIVLANGGQNAISLVFQTILKGDRPVVLAEDLTYAGFRHAANLLRAETIGLVSDEAGVRPDAFEAACRAHDAQVFCTSPEVHNPTALRTGLERRRELADIARRYNVQILEDDCYALADSDLPFYRALLPKQSWYVSSISKLISPSFRLGFAVAPQGKGDQLRRTGQYNFFGIATPMSELAADMLGAPEMEALISNMQQRVAALVQIAVNHLGSYDLRWRNDVPFLWLALPRGWRAGSFCSAAEKAGVLLRSADDFTLIDGRAPHSVRIAINGQVSEACYESALVRLRDLLGNPPSQIEV